MFSLLILSIAFPQEIAAETEMGSTSLARETQGELQPITRSTAWQDSSCGGRICVRVCVTFSLSQLSKKYYEK